MSPLFILHTLLVSLGVLAGVYAIFGVADRYAIFLYGHLGATPFDAVTSSRYWMTGLVLAGALLPGYAFANFVTARLAKSYRAPPWRLVWLGCLPLLEAGIPAIVMNVNQPVMPPEIAAALAASTLAGLALALPTGEWAAARPRDLVWLALDGAGLALPLLLFRALELPGRGLSVSPGAVALFAGVSLIGGCVWLAGMSIARLRLRVALPTTLQLCASGLAWAYLLLPLIHFVVATPHDYKYITTAFNFFAFDLRLQALTFGLVWVVALITTTWRNKSGSRRE